MSRGSLPSFEDDFSRALLGSAEADAPSHAAYAKAAAALGIGVGLGVGASLPASAAVAVGAASVAGVARWSSSLSAKWVAFSVTGALFVGAGALLLGSFSPAKPVPRTALASARRSLAASEPVSASAASPGSAASPVSPESPATDHDLSRLPLVSALASPRVADSAAAKSGERRALSAPAHVLPVSPPTRRNAHAASASALSTRGSSGSSLAEQVQSLDRARVALASGDSSSALREIARYRATWPEGVFLTEASVLEIEALAARGERSLTAKRAADFVAAHPDSPQADRLRALIRAKKTR